MTTAHLDLNVLRILELVHMFNLLRSVMEPSVRSTINNQELLDKETWDKELLDKETWDELVDKET